MFAVHRDKWFLFVHFNEKAQACRYKWWREEVHSALSQQHPGMCESMSHWRLFKSMIIMLKLCRCVFLSAALSPLWADALRLLMHVLLLHLFNYAVIKASQIYIPQTLQAIEIIPALMAHIGNPEPSIVNTRGTAVCMFTLDLLQSHLPTVYFADIYVPFRSSMGNKTVPVSSQTTLLC